MKRFTDSSSARHPSADTSTTLATHTIGALLAMCLALASGCTPSQAPVGYQTRSQPTGCLNILRTLDAAKTQFAIEHGKTNGDSVTMVDLAPYLRGAHIVCPAGGHYDLRPIGLDPVCSLGTNAVSYHRQTFLWYTYNYNSGNMHRIRQ